MGQRQRSHLTGTAVGTNRDPASRSSPRKTDRTRPAAQPRGMGRNLCSELAACVHSVPGVTDVFSWSPPAARKATVEITARGGVVDAAVAIGVTGRRPAPQTALTVQNVIRGRISGWGLAVGRIRVRVDLVEPAGLVVRPHR